MPVDLAGLTLRPVNRPTATAIGAAFVCRRSTGGTWPAVWPSLRAGDVALMAQCEEIVFRVAGYPLSYAVGDLLIGCVAPAIGLGLCLGFKGLTWREMSATRKWALVAGLLAWLCVVPNAAYSMTLARRMCAPGVTPQPPEYAFFCLYTLLALAVYYASLRTVAVVLAAVFGTSRDVSRLFIPLISFGVLIGWHVRLNSWDLVLRPRTCLSSVFHFAADRISAVDYLSVLALLLLSYHGMRWGLSVSRRLDP
ncbi:MAG: DUF1361 domain-containing protein [Thermodesulfobacteriota bacterium]